jgi:hypothetical protein
VAGKGNKLKATTTVASDSIQQGTVLSPILGNDNTLTAKGSTTHRVIGNGNKVTDLGGTVSDPNTVTIFGNKNTVKNTSFADSVTIGASGAAVNNASVDFNGFDNRTVTVTVNGEKVKCTTTNGPDCGSV